MYTYGGAFIILFFFIYRFDFMYLIVDPFFFDQLILDTIIEQNAHGNFYFFVYLDGPVMFSGRTILSKSSILTYPSSLAAIFKVVPSL